MKKVLSLVISFVMAVTMIFQMGFAGSSVYADIDSSDVEHGIITEKSTYVGSGVKQTQMVSVDKYRNQHVDYLFEVDLNDPSAGLMVGYKDYNYVHEDKSTWGLQTVPKQIVAAEKATGRNVVGSINGDFFDMATGEPSGVLVMDGEIKHNSAGRNYFAIKKDGTAVIDSQNVIAGGEGEGLYEFAIGGDRVVVKNGELTDAAINSSDADGAARSAVGIKADGSVVLFATSGVNSPITYGYNFREVAKIMKSKGCVDVLMLDGGGSTTFVSKYEGEDVITVRNNPADGSERQVCTCLMVTSEAKASVDNATLTECEKNGHQYKHNDGDITCSACDFNAKADGFTGLVKDEVTDKYILFKKGVKTKGFAPYGYEDAYYFESDGYGYPATLVEKVDSDCTIRGYRNYKNKAGTEYRLLDVTACGHDYVNSKCVKCGWKQVNINDCTIKLGFTKVGYDGKAHTPKSTVTAPNGKKLVIRQIYNSGDFSATVANNVEMGTATLTYEPLWYYVNITEERGTVIGTRVEKYQIVPYPAENLKIQHPSKTSVKLSWEPSDSAGLDYLIEYDIYQKKGSGDWKKIGKTSETTYSVSKLTANTSYSYRIMATAKAKDGKYYDSWQYAYNKTKTIDKLKAPASVKTSNDAKTGKNQIKWSTAKNAEAYAIYRSTSKKGKYSLIATTKSTSYIDKKSVAGKNYYYKVKSLFTTNEYFNSGDSKIVSRTCDLARPSITLNNKTKKKIKVSWKAVPGASKYKVYYKAPGKKWKAVKTTKSKSYTKTKLKKGKTYQFKVMAIYNGNSGANSAYSVVKKAKSK